MDALSPMEMLVLCFMNYAIVWEELSPEKKLFVTIAVPIETAVETKVGTSYCFDLDKNKIEVTL